MSKKFEEYAISQFNNLDRKFDSLLLQMIHFQNQVQTQFANVDIRLTRLETKIDDVRNELKADMATLRGELKADMVALRNELKSDMVIFRDELKSDMSSLEGRLEQKLADLKIDMSSLESRLEQKLSDLKTDVNNWSIAYNLHDKMVFKHHNDIRLIKAYVGLEDDITLTQVLKDSGDWNPKVPKMPRNKA